MHLIHAILLGIVQGLTEFLPISSSGHLILARHLLGIGQETQAAFVFDILVQMGTWLAVVIFYWRDLLAIATDMLRGLAGKPGPQARLGWLIGLATIPALIVGWMTKDAMTGEMSGLFFTGIFLIVNAVLLTIAELAGHRKRQVIDVKWVDALWIGLFQAIALLPAVSRSAATISGGMTTNLTRRDAARFAFLMSVPVMPAAAVVGLLDLGSLPNAAALIFPLAVGFLVAAVVGFLSIRWLLGYLSNHSFFPFVCYCLVVGGAVTVMSLLA